MTVKSHRYSCSKIYVLLTELDNLFPVCMSLALPNYRRLIFLLRNKDCVQDLKYFSLCYLQYVFCLTLKYFRIFYTKYPHNQYITKCYCPGFGTQVSGRGCGQDPDDIWYHPMSLSLAGQRHSLSSMKKGIPSGGRKFARQNSLVLFSFVCK